ncbi:hypothetical protein TSARBOMBA_248 [Bacillus phage TsarBomba]|uniref:Uncharacterized protein n=1 Tax=Bacillus phage TsarBomba TaxID=1690456 RepID=A0A0K2D033_9CAUD|nr:hypothetical protein TSARBOMBA_248 [Bacillus phage TsarBomba]ALA13088.1 hypothetical protein TSARBOMBA_248 [Bacillus phage TsarBomba]
MSKHEVVMYIESGDAEHKVAYEAANKVTELMNDGYAVTSQYRSSPTGKDNWRVNHQIYIEGKREVKEEIPYIMTHEEYNDILSSIGAFHRGDQMDHNAHLHMIRFVNKIYQRQQQHRRG